MTTATIQPTADFDHVQLPDAGRRVQALAVIGLLLLLVSLVTSGFSSAGLTRMFHAYLLSICFYVSINLGALFFVILQHLTGARWSVVMRRVAELMTTTTPVLFVLMVPIIGPMLFGNADLYEWNNVTLRETDELIQAKAAYLNTPFFTLRWVAYFCIWIFLSRFFTRRSLQQDSSGDVRLSHQMRRISAPAMVVFAITINFAAFDWLMSLDPHWFSTIFGVYFFAGCAVAFFAALPVACACLQWRGYATREITTEHYHDVAKLLFGFLMFWAYIAFSQYLLIWYANIPEETLWYSIRQRHVWQLLGLLLIVGHFALPFFGLMSRSARRDRKTLLFWSAILLVMHWFDLFWVIMPNVSEDSLPLGAVELLCLLGVGAIWLSTFVRNASGKRLIPTGDPHLRESLSFHNV